ncbi:hypothetical protein AB6A40_009022 [Gnathostoma spinigerum]|uniref:Uncharacterized protein n=1 Tax=Gnathostoma spinigerum TaxID=75299 RepID=A0ABD6EQT4_9BILA
MSSGNYHGRWASRGQGLSTLSNSISSSVEPSSYGTSWNSVRWNKPGGYGGRTARMASAIESTTPVYKTYGSRYRSSVSDGQNRTSSKSNTNQSDLGYLGPSVRERSSRFGQMLASTNRNDSYSVSTYKSPSRSASTYTPKSIMSTSAPSAFRSDNPSSVESSGRAVRNAFYGSRRYGSFDNRTIHTGQFWSYVNSSKTLDKPLFFGNFRR